MSEKEYLLRSGGSSSMLAVKVDRCCNTYWRCLLCVAFFALALILAVTMIKSRNEVESPFGTNWKSHWSQSQSGGTASKKVVESKGRNVIVEEETFEDYIDYEDDQYFSMYPESNEYYDEDNPDLKRSRMLSEDYRDQYSYDEKAAQREGLGEASLGIVPHMKDYSLQDNFKKMFREPNQEEIMFDPNYRNPCWAESIPKYPYQMNSYLNVREQARILEPDFQSMRKKFAARKGTDDKWRLRCLPSFYVMETPPTATPSLFTVLGYHPYVSNPKLAEPEFWNLRGLDNVATLQDYLDLFDSAADDIHANTTEVEVNGIMQTMHKKLTGDGTSSYLWTMDNWALLPDNANEPEPKLTTAHLIHSITPDAKIIIMLRNPTERLFHGYLSRTEDPSAADFHEKVGRAMQAMSNCEESRTLRSCLYDTKLNKRLPVRLRIGMYFPYVEEWVSVFGHDQVMVIKYEDYIKSTSQIINDACAFLNLSPFPTEDLEIAEKRVQAIEARRESEQKVQILSATKAMLKEFHKILNEKLSDILADEKFLWSEFDIDTSIVQEPPAVDLKSKPTPASIDQPSTTVSKLSFKERLAEIREKQRAALSHQQSLLDIEKKKWLDAKMQRILLRNLRNSTQRPILAGEDLRVQSNVARVVDDDRLEEE